MSVTANAISIFVAFLFGILGVYLSKFQSYNRLSGSVDWFWTARNSQSWWSIAFALLTTSIGSWILFLPSKMAGDPDNGSSGLIILIFYAIAASYPILLIAFLAEIMETKYPSVKSLTEYVGSRFGEAAACYIYFVTIFITGIGLVAEYTALGKLFEFFHSSSTVAVLCIGLSTLLVSASGGLHVSLIINQLQMMLSIVMLLIITIYAYLAIDSQSKTLEPINVTHHAVSTIIAMLVSYHSLFVFTDGIWQRAFSAKSRQDLKVGAWVSTILTLVIIFSIGAMGYLGFAKGLVPDRRVCFVEIFRDAPESIQICVMLLGVSISQGLISSFQHSFTGSVISLCSLFGFKESLVSTRIISIFLHIPLMLIGLLELEITDLFLIANSLTITSVLPVLLGLVPQFEDYITGSSVLLGCAFSLISVFLFGYVTTGEFANGIFRVLFDDYSWEPFVIALISSLVGVGLCVLIEMSLFSCADGPTTTQVKIKRQILPNHSYNSYQTSNIVSDDD